MNISFYFKNLDPTQAVKSYTAKKLAKIEKLVHHSEGIDARFFLLKKEHICEITIHADNKVFHVKKADKNMYVSIDLVIHALQKAIDRYHKKKKTSHEEENINSHLPVFEKKEKPLEEVEISIFEVPHKPMYHQEAFLQLREHRYKFMMYRNMNTITKRFSLLFLRPDGNYSVVSPSYKLREYNETIYREDYSNSEFKKISSSKYPMSSWTIYQAIGILHQNQSDYLAFVNQDTSKMNILFHSRSGNLILKKPAA